MNNKIFRSISDLYKHTFHEDQVSINKLAISGSSRSYFRVSGEKYTAIATYNTDVKENKAFLYLSRHFKDKGIHVPEVFSVNKEYTLYIQEDLGDESLFDLTQRLRKDDLFPSEVIELYKKAIEQLAELQIEGGKGLDYSVCYPRGKFDKQSMLWDLNYFKYNFLKLTGIRFDEQLLENDIHTLIEFLLQAKTDYFLFRDFKSLNIMVRDNEVYFIDYQGGRKGAIHYDIASILHEAKANIPEKIKNELLRHYIKYMGSLIKFNEEDFMDHYYAYTLIRILQAMGTYGFRGLYEKKQHYIDSIPLRLNSLKAILNEIKIIDKMPELNRILNELPELELFKAKKDGDSLSVSVKSFSYRKGIPIDTTGNGGGFVFDCRFLNNPGRIEKYKKLCGKDKEVIAFLEADDDVKNYFMSLKQIIGNSIDNYIARDFKNLAINFGCTGGQHRSVFFAEKISKFINENYKIRVELIHTEGF